MKSHYLQFADLNCIFEQYDAGNFWEIWNLRLDSYRVPEFSGPCDLTICRNESIAADYDAIPETCQLVDRTSAGFFEMRVYQLADGDTCWDYVRKSTSQSMLRFLVTENWHRISLLCDHTESNNNAAFMWLSAMLPGVFLQHDALTFHGVLLEYEGRGIILSAPSGTGKTTHARLWRDHKNALIINGDRAVCRFKEQQWIGYGIPWSGSSGEQINRSVPIEAVVVLTQGKENTAKRLYGLDAFGAVWPNVLYPNWEEELCGKAVDLIDKFMGDIPIISLRCRPDQDAVDVLHSYLFEEVLK